MRESALSTSTPSAQRRGIRKARIPSASICSRAERRRILQVDKDGRLPGCVFGAGPNGDRSDAAMGPIRARGQRSARLCSRYRVHVCDMPARTVDFAQPLIRDVRVTRKDVTSDKTEPFEPPRPMVSWRQPEGARRFRRCAVHRRHELSKASTRPAAVDPAQSERSLTSTRMSYQVRKTGRTCSHVPTACPLTLGHQCLATAVVGFVSRNGHHLTLQMRCRPSLIVQWDEDSSLRHCESRTLTAHSVGGLTMGPIKTLGGSANSADMRK